MIIVDAHLDLAYNAINYQRDLKLSVAEIREIEKKSCPNGVATVSIPDLKKTGVGLIFPTIFVLPASSKLNKGESAFAYRDAAEAHRLAMTQLDYYHRLVDEDESIQLVGNLTKLNEVIELATGEENGRILGLVPLMEGADPVREPEELEMWYERGVRIIGPAWDDTRYAAGAWRGSRFGLTKEGHHLLDVMAEYGFILDITHMSEKASFEALDRFEGTVVATHTNARALVPGERQLSDAQIRAIGERGGVIGTVLYNPFLKAGHVKGERKEHVTLAHVVSHIDHICQLLGNADHIGIGSDFDGGFGAEDIPADFNSVFELPKIAEMLKEHGYTHNHIEKIMGLNWVNVLSKAWH
jgi:membrane dipeptidase